MNLFPAAFPSGKKSEALPLAVEAKWDFKKNIPIFLGGEPVRVEGLEAVKVWAFKALKTMRYRLDIYSAQYGSELYDLMGQPYSEAVKQSRAFKIVERALLCNPYIRSVEAAGVSQEGDALVLNIDMTTIYGKTEVEADVD